MAETTAERNTQATLTELAEWVQNRLEFMQAEVARHDANLGKVGSLGVSIYNSEARSMAWGYSAGYLRVLEKIQQMLEG